jgi:hypothetical protein
LGLNMQHVKDTALLIVTFWAAIVAGRVIALIIFYAWPAGLESDTGSAIILCALMLFAGFVAGAHLMKHLKWAAKFWILALVPFCYVALSIVANAVRLAGDDALLDKLGWATWAQLELLVFASGILAGAVVRKILTAASSMPNKSMEPTR